MVQMVGLALFALRYKTDEERMPFLYSVQNSALASYPCPVLAACLSVLRYAVVVLTQTRTTPSYATDIHSAVLHYTTAPLSRTAAAHCVQRVVLTRSAPLYQVLNDTERRYVPLAPSLGLMLERVMFQVQIYSVGCY